MLVSKNTPKPKPMGDKYRVAFEIGKTDDAKLQQLANAEQTTVNAQVDKMDKDVRNTVANRFTQGFFNGAYSDLKANAAMAYTAATDPLGTAWKVGEALVTIPLLPTKIGVQLGQAAIELSNLKPEQRQALVDELIKKGYTSLRDLPVGDAAEKAGEIVGTIAMEAILAKGVSTAGKVSLEGLEALKGTKFAAQITELAKATKQTIAETQVPVRATVQTMADTAGGTRKVVNVESKSLGEVIQNLEARAKQVLSGGAEDAARVKPIGLPAWSKLEVDLEHIVSGHKAGGSRLAQSSAAGGAKDVFPATMTDKQILKAIETAYGNAKKVETQELLGEKRVRLIGVSNSSKIEMWLNITRNKLETAYPINR